MNEQALVEVVLDSIRAPNYASLSIPQMGLMAENIVKTLKAKGAFSPPASSPSSSSGKMTGRSLDNLELTGALKAAQAAWKESGMFDQSRSSDDSLPITLLAIVKLFLDLEL